MEKFWEQPPYPDGRAVLDVITEQVQKDSRKQAHPVENPGGSKGMVSLGLNQRNQRVLGMSLVVIRCGQEESQCHVNEFDTLF